MSGPPRANNGDEERRKAARLSHFHAAKNFHAPSTPSRASLSQPIPSNLEPPFSSCPVMILKHDVIPSRPVRPFHVRIMLKSCRLFANDAPELCCVYFEDHLPNPTHNREHKSAIHHSSLINNRAQTETRTYKTVQYSVAHTNI